MMSDDTFKAGVIEHLREIAESPEQLSAAIENLNKPTAPSLISDVARRTNREVAELSESAAEEKAVIRAAQDQVGRFDNWWGKMTGQHASASDDLERITESSTAKLNMIGAKIEDLQEHFDAVVVGAFEQKGAEPDTLDAV